MLCILFPASLGIDLTTFLQQTPRCIKSTAAFIYWRYSL